MKKKVISKSSKKLDRILAVFAIALLLAAWILGSFRSEAELLPFLKQALPDAAVFEPAAGGAYAAWKDDARENLIGYVAVGAAHGYGGELKLAVAVDPEGKVLGSVLIEHKETPSFWRRVINRGLLETLQGKKYSDSFVLSHDVDSITGATYSCRALADAVRRAGRSVATKNLGLPDITEAAPKIIFGISEIALIFLFIFGVIGRLHRFKYKKAARWISMLVGLGVLGFLYNKPLTLVFINKMLLGFWPVWQLNLFWYILLFGILFLYIFDNRNPYCEWFCPFGSAQECLGMIGGAKVRVTQNIRSVLRWFQRMLALSVIVIALYYRNPSSMSYEIFGAFFRFIGTNFHFILLGIVLVAALFIKRPWCSYLCPLRPVTDFIRMARNWIRDIWRTVR